jgi:hypothetical protein
MKKFSFIIAGTAIFIAGTVFSCKKDVKVTDVQLNKAELTLLIDQTETLFANVLPTDAANTKVKWESSHPTVAKVADGLVTAVAPGKVNITVKTEDGDKTAICIVKVKRNLSDPDPVEFGEEKGPVLFVSKNLETRNFLLEKFTGVNCGPCVNSGHKQEDLLKNTFQEKVFLINIHATSLANAAPPDDLRTDFGNEFVSFSGLDGVPLAMINRFRFPEQYHDPKGSRTLWYTDWSSAINSVINEPTYVNVAAQTIINKADRKLECKVQVYYTADAPVATNNINVAILQNELIAKQTNASSYPERVTPDGKFRHMHVLRHLITGQWGEAIDSDKKKDNFYEKTFTWNIPTEMRNIPIPLENVEVLVFVTEGAQAPVAKVCKSTIDIK